MKNILINHAGFGAGSGGMTMDLLWENASPTSDFGQQTISLDLSEYDGAAVHAGTDTVLVAADFIPIGKTLDVVSFSGVSSSGAVPTMATRSFSASAAGVVVGDCYSKVFNKTTYETTNAYQKPQKIYGIKTK